MRVVVTGDVVVDHHVYEGERSNPAQTESRGVHVVRELGGAMGLTRLIERMCSIARASQDKARLEYQQQHAKHKAGLLAESPQEPPPEPLEDVQTEFGLTLPDAQALPCGHHGLAIFKPYGRRVKEPEDKVWRARLLLGYGHDNPHPAASQSVASVGNCDIYQLKPTGVPPGDILILDDAAYMFRRSEPCWLLDQADAAKWIVVKMSGPVCKGRLWKTLRKYRKKLVVVVSAKELRRERAGISQGLSWERTIEDLARALANDPMLKRLQQCKHLVVTFSADGALWLENSRSQYTRSKAHLIYDPSSIEGQWAEQTDGEAFGYMSCQVAAITKVLVRNIDSSTNKIVPLQPSDYSAGIRAGLAAMRNLRSEGHGVVGDDPPTGYPVSRLANVLLNPKERFSTCSVPWASLSASNYVSPTWQIAIQSQLPAGGSSYATMPMSGLAQEVVRRGRRVLTSLPHATFGKLFTIDRVEIETLRTLRQLMKNYGSANKNTKPLSIGVFGPPGAGKSFGVKQIANEIFGKDAWLEFNLSQFSLNDLTGALHQVRDKVLEAGIAVVFWDEFDSKNYQWLQYLLAPMQDGQFQEAQVSHPIGRCVFIFAGATSYSFHDFGVKPPVNEEDGKGREAWGEYKLKKGPDFMSRLDGYYNVLGPNQRVLGPGVKDVDDRCYPIRRSLLLRQFLCGNSKDQLDIDPGLLRALLEVPKYKNGARSLEKLSQTMKPDVPAGPVRRSDLCSPSHLAMFVDFS